MLSAMFVQAIGCIGYILIPAIGPAYSFPEWYHISISGSVITDFTREFINKTRINRDCFPSLHAGLSTVFYFALLKQYKKTFILITPLILSLCFSCVFLRYHYVIDVLAGILLALLCMFFTEKYFGDHYRDYYGKARDL